MECPVCRVVYSLTGGAIGRTAKCRCGHRFAVTGPQFVTIPADRACLCICSHCQNKVVASQDAPAATVLCCRCGKTFQKDLTISKPQSQLAAPPPAFIPHGSVPAAPASGPADSAEDAVRAIVAEWAIATQESRSIEDPPASKSTSTGTVSSATEITPSAITVTAYRTPPWFTYQCPTCSCHTAFMASEVNNAVKCALCLSRMRLQVADTLSEQSAAGNPDLWLQCRCPHCRRRIAVDVSHRGKTIYCPTCFDSFTAPGEAVVTGTSTFHYPNPSAAYAHRPLPVRSYRKKNGTVVNTYRRSQPRKRR